MTNDMGQKRKIPDFDVAAEAARRAEERQLRTQQERLMVAKRRLLDPAFDEAVRQKWRLRKARLREWNRLHEQNTDVKEKQVLEVEIGEVQAWQLELEQEELQGVTDILCDRNEK